MIDLKWSLILVFIILRINNHTDEEWIKRMEKYFTIEKTEYYRMNQEKEGVKRRLFFLRACLP